MNAKKKVNPITMTPEQYAEDRAAHKRGNDLVPVRERNAVCRRLDRAYAEIDALHRAIRARSDAKEAAE